MDFADLKKLVRAVRCDLAALVSDLGAPDFGPATRNGNSADAECLIAAFNKLSDDLPDLIESMERNDATANARLIAAAQAAFNCIGELPPTQARIEVAQMLRAALPRT